MKIQLLLYLIPFGFSLPINRSPVSTLSDLSSSHAKRIDLDDLNSLLQGVKGSLLAERVVPIQEDWKVPQPLRIKNSQHISELFYDGSVPVISKLEIWQETKYFGKKIIVTYTPVNIFITKNKIKIFAIENVLGSKSNAYPVIITIFNRNLLGAKERYNDLKDYYISYDSKSSHLMYSNDQGLILVGPNFVSRRKDYQDTASGGSHVSLNSLNSLNKNY